MVYIYCGCILGGMALGVFESVLVGEEIAYGDCGFHTAMDANTLAVLFASHPIQSFASVCIVILLCLCFISSHIQLRLFLYVHKLVKIIYIIIVCTGHHRRKRRAEEKVPRPTD